MFATRTPSTGLLDVHSGSICYAQPNFLDDVAASTPQAIVVDGELVMAIDLPHRDCLREENGNDSGA